MKSSEADLRNRGAANDTDIEEAANLLLKELFNRLHASVPAQRTAAVIALHSKCSLKDNAYILLLLKSLVSELALYTKIEICNTLESGNTQAAQMMCEYLGKIGKNQHTEVPDTVSKKKSYPLPRDIIARTLGKMDKGIAPVLFEQLEQASEHERLKVSELLDAIGYLLFCNPELATETNFHHIKSAYERYSDDELIMWRVSLCCSAFPIAESTILLKEIGQRTANRTIVREVERSMKLLRVKTNVR